MIMPNLNFNCNGRITGVTASMYAVRRTGSLPVFQVWHPLSPGSNVYSKISQVRFEAPEGKNITRVYISTVLLTRIDQIEFQLGDVIGCYQPFNSRYTVGTINDTIYTSYSTNSSSLTTTTINVLSGVNYFETTDQLLISVMIGKYNEDGNGKLISVVAINELDG